jgi:DNA replication and repair protein RecF
MIFKKLEVANFRNIEKMTLEPSDGINVIFGQNAQGKTAILEALWCFTGAKSFRGSKDNEMVKFGSDFSKLSLNFFDGGRDQDCIINIDKSRSAIFNGIEYSSASKIAGKIYIIVFSPNDLNIIKDGPAFRRKFLDTAIFQLYPKYIEISKRYLRAVDQRNKILKEIKYNPNLQEFRRLYSSFLVEAPCFLTLCLTYLYPKTKALVLCLRFRLLYP